MTGPEGLKSANRMPVPEVLSAVGMASGSTEGPVRTSYPSSAPASGSPSQDGKETDSEAASGTSGWGGGDGGGKPPVFNVDIPDAPEGNIGGSDPGLRQVISKSRVARLHLEKANNNIEQAKRLVDEGKEVKARETLARAEYDAELALALAEENRVRKELRAAQKTIDKLRKQLQGEARS